MGPDQERQPSLAPSSTRSSRLPVDTSSTSNLLADDLDGQEPAITSLEHPQAPQPVILNNRSSQTPNSDIPRVVFQVAQHANSTAPSARHWKWPSWSSLLDRLVSVTGRKGPRAARGSASSPDPVADSSSGGRVWREWRSKKLGTNWLAFQLVLTLGIGATVFGLGEYSRVHSGFIRLGSPPAFISDNPDLMKAIWMQGWQYTTVPVSLMTLYRVMWDGIVAAISERQPYVELMKGAGPEKTLLLDYRAEWQITAPYKAYKTGHWFLGVCMVMSIVLSFGVVPSIAFLFTTQESAYQYPVPLTFECAIDYSAIRHPPSNGPSGGTALEWAAATSLMNAPPLSWTNGTYAFPTFSLTNDLPSSDNQDPIDPIPITVNSTAYLVRPNCIPLRENLDYSSALVAPQIPGLSTALLLVRGTDRNCSFSSDLLFNLRPESKEFRPMATKIYQRQFCQQTADPRNLNGTRLTLVSGKYTGDRDKGYHSVSNVSVVSCNPTYWAVPGILNLTLVANPSNMSTITDRQFIGNSEGRHVATIASFEADWSRAVQHIDGEHVEIEGILLLEMAFDPSLDIQVPTSNLARFAFEVAARSQDNQSGNDEPPQPSALAKSLGDLLERAYTVIAATMLTRPLTRTNNDTGDDQDQVGYASISETRIVVQQGVSYFVVSMLSIVAGLLVAIIFHERHKRSALFEEPIGLLCVAGITQRSEHLKEEINKLNNNSRFRGKFREDALKDEKFMATNWQYDIKEGHIYDTKRGRVEQITRR